MPTPTGTLPMSYVQGAIEVSRGTILPATRKQPIASGFMQEMVERVKVAEQRGTYIKNYRSHQIQRHVEISGMNVNLSYEDAPWFFQFFLKGGVAAVADSGTPTPAQTYTFTPTPSVDDLKTANLEVGDDTQNFSIPYCLGQRMQLGFNTDGPMTASFDWLGQRAVKQAKTAAMADRVVEDIIGSDGVVTIDDTVIGTTQPAYPLSMQVTVENGWQQLWTLGGTKYPSSAYRGEVRMMAVEMVCAFDTTNEWDKFVTSPAQRKIRYKVQGSQIHATPTVANKSLQVDWYGYWDEASFGEQNGLKTLTLRGESHFDPTFAFDWGVTVVNSLVTLP